MRQKIANRKVQHGVPVIFQPQLVVLTSAFIKQINVRLPMRIVIPTRGFPLAIMNRFELNEKRDDTRSAR